MIMFELRKFQRMVTMDRIILKANWLVSQTWHNYKLSMNWVNQVKSYPYSKKAVPHIYYFIYKKTFWFPMKSLLVTLIRNTYFQLNWIGVPIIIWFITSSRIIFNFGEKQKNIIPDDRLGGDYLINRFECKIEKYPAWNWRRQLEMN